MKAILTLCLMLFAATTLQAQNLKPFKAENGKFGYKNDKGKIIIVPKYDNAYDFSEGMAAVNIGAVVSLSTGLVGGKWGFIDGTGKEVILLKYAAVTQFNEGLAAFISGYYLDDTKNVWGYLDKTGKEVISAKYSYAEVFENGKAKVELNGRTFYIDKTGKEIRSNQPATKNTATPANNPVKNNSSKPATNTKNDAIAYSKLAGVWNVTTKDHQTGVIGTMKLEIRIVNGKPEAWRVANGKADLKYTKFTVFKNESNAIAFNFELNVPPGLKSEGKGTWNDELTQMKGIQLTSGFGVNSSAQWSAVKEAVAITTNNTTNTPTENPVNKDGSKNNLQAQKAYIFKGPNNLYGLKDSKGAVILAPKYDDINKFENGLARVRLGKIEDIDNWKYGFIDVYGKEVIPAKYNRANGFYEGLAAVRLDKKMGFINQKGEVVIPFIYSSAGSFHEGLAAVATGDYPNKKWGFIDKTGKTILPFIYDMANWFSEGIAVVKIKDKYGYINKAGKQVIPVEYDGAYEFSEGLAPVNKGGVYDNYDVKGGKWGFIDKTGKTIISFIYDDVSSFSEGLACVMQNKKAGYIDKTGKVIIPLQYGLMNSFQYGKAYVSLNGRYFYIDKTGKEAKPSVLVNFSNGTYTGEVGNDGTTPNGNGKMVWDNGNIYEGQWLNGIKQGTGKLIWANGDVYEGQWQNDKMHGKGKLTSKEGKVYEGDFANDKFVKATALNYPANNTVNTTSASVANILNEDFTNNRNQWPTGSNNDATTTISNGQYIYEMKQSYYHFNWLPGNVLTKINQQKDFTMEMQFSVLSGYEEYPVWFLWGLKDMQNQFAFNITATGKYEYSKKVNDVVTVIIPSKSSTAIKKGKNVVNKLSVKKAGNKIEFYINDTLADTAPYENFNPYTTVGILLQNQKKIAVDYIRITQ